MREVRFEVDGESVAGKLWEPAGEPKGQLVLVHGLLSQAAEFAEAGVRLAERGWRVLAVDQRGFGASGGERGIIRTSRATADVLGAVAWLRKEKPGVPVGLVGHSMGALFTLNALVADSSIRAAVVATPMWSVRAELGDAEFQMYRVAGALSRLKSRVGLGDLLVPYKYDYDRLFHDPDAARRAREQAFLVRQVNLRNYDEFMAMDSTQHAREVTQPTLVIVADYDRAVKREHSMRVYEALAGEKELATLPCGHSLWGDLESQRAIDLVEAWFERHLAA